MLLTGTSISSIFRSVLPLSILCIVFIFCGTVGAQNLSTLAPDPAAPAGGVGFVRAHWATSINKMIVLLVPGKNTSVRALDPVTNSWEFLWPQNTLGIQGRDNFYSFYVPRLDEIWVWDGSYLWDVPDAFYSGRFSISKRQWITRGKTNTDAFAGLIDMSAVGGMPQNGIDPAMAWANGIDTGLLFVGGQTYIFEPKREGPEQYRAVAVPGPQPPYRSQSENGMVSDGKDFYLSGGLYQLPNDPAWYYRRDLWKFDSSSRRWEELPSPPDMALAQVVTFDSDRNAIVTWVKNHLYVYDIAQRLWSDDTPAEGLPSISNQTGVYAPTTKLHLFSGGNLNDNMPAGDFSGPSPGPQVFAINLTGSRTVSVATTSSTAPSGMQEASSGTANTGLVVQPASTLTAIDRGVTGEDKVGQSNQTTPNGKPDFHISASGLRGKPATVTISSDTGGIWEVPFNGTNWIIATSYDGNGNGEFWFEQFASTHFHLKVRYADGTGDEADAAVLSPTVAALATTVAPSLSQPSANSTPSPSSQATAGLDIPVRTWIARPFTTPFAPAAGPEGHGGVGSKHLRFAQNPLNGKIYILGGDYYSDVISDVQLWTYDAFTDQWAREKEPPCGVQGETIPGSPDEVAWVWDSKRNQFWVMPGFFFLSEDVVGKCGVNLRGAWDVQSPITLTGYWAVNLIKDYTTGPLYFEGVNFTVSPGPGPDQITITNINIPAGHDLGLDLAPLGNARQKIGVFTYDPVARRWNFVQNTSEEAGPRNGIYDPVTDSIWRSSYDGGRGLYWSQYHIATNTRDVYFTPNATDGTYINDAGFSSEYIAADITDRKIYGVDPIGYRLLEFDMDQHTVSIKAPIPEPSATRVAAARARSYPFKDFTMPVFDSVNHVLLYPFVTDLASDWVPTGPDDFTGSRPRLLIYHPDTDTWETDPMYQPEGREIRANSFFFDPINDVLFAVGGLAKGGDADGSVTHYFLYRYASGTGQSSPPPAIAPVATVPSTLSATFLGVKGEDKVGEMNQITSNGNPDFQMSVSGLRPNPRKVTITSDTGGIWETPFNGSNWIIATNYDGNGNGNYWFEPFSSNNFRVRVVYADGTSDTANAVNQVAPVPIIATQPSVNLSPFSIAFPLQPVGGISGQQQVSLLNNGTGRLHINAITANGEFSETSNCPSEVDPGAKCTITVTFQPLGAGTRNGTLTLTSDAPGSPHVVDLTGVAAIPVSPDTTAPLVSLVLPVGRLSGTITGKITASDNIGVVKIEVYKDGVLFARTDSSRYSFQWETTAETNGPHTFIAVAYDAASNRSSSIVTADVLNISPPTIRIVAPTRRSTINASSVLLVASITSRLPVAAVQFKVDGVSLGNQLTGGASTLLWDTTTVEVGNHVLEASVTDSLGNVANSPEVPIHIMRPAATPKSKKTSLGRHF